MNTDHFGVQPDPKVGALVNAAAEATEHFSDDELEAAADKLRKKTMEDHNTEPSCCREMPRYRCHKEVHALKIKAIELDSVKAQAEGRETDGSAIITPADGGYAQFRVRHDYVHKHKPEVGGYYVVYADGYASFSPAKAFEDGYTLIK